MTLVTQQNPLGLDGFEFVEFTSPDPAAMKALIAAAEAAGLWKLLSRVFVENRASLALLRSVGFREVGVHEKHGKLDGVWRDVVAVERVIEANLG